ncbi:MAG: glycosyltransferase [Gammaproteobacteria bacterium]|nr:glycosyltransferase [Gammaproteobacteria bacterium]
MSKSSSIHTVANAASAACTIIIPTKDKLEFLQPCLESVLATTTASPFNVLLIDNNSEELATRKYLDSLTDEPLVRVVEWNHPFNYSALNNFAATLSDAEVLCFLNNDIEILQYDWLDHLLPMAQRQDVGAVGCLLLYPDRSIQHGGVALDQYGFARHIARHEQQNFFARFGLDHPFAVEAITAACMLTRRDLFLGLGGFNAETLAIAYNDVDYCLRLAEQDLPCLIHPAVCHIHHESISRQDDKLEINQTRAKKEFDFVLGRWRNLLQGRQYESGLPEQIAYQIATQNNLTTTIKRAKGILFPDAPASESITSVANTPVRAANSSTEIFAIQQREIDVLRAQTIHLKEAHRLIEQSAFWRMTAPLRYLWELIPRRQIHHKVHAGSTEASNRPITKNHRNGSILDNNISASISKADYDAKAKIRLNQFLCNQQRLTFAITERPEISILLVFFNQAHLSYLCLESLLEHGDVPFEIIIVDNASTDQTNELLQRLDQVTVQHNDSNLGFVHAVNQGAQLAKSPCLLLLNNDALLEPATLSSALQTLQSAPDIVTVGAKIKLLDGSLQEAGSIIWNDGSCAGYGRGEDPQNYAFMMQREVDYCSGAFLLIDAKIFREMGGFDLDFAPAYYEESDFCIRLHEKGYRVIYEPKAQITHYEFASSGGKSQASKLQRGHRVILCQKHASYLQAKLTREPDNLLLARTANQHRNFLVIDDRVPYPSLGAGYPRCLELLNALASTGVGLTFYPLQFPHDDWEQVYTVLNPTIEVVIGEGQAGLATFLQKRQGFYQKIMVSRLHNIDVMYKMLEDQPDLLGKAELIYDAEAVTATREIMRRRLWGEQVSKEEEDKEIAKEIELASKATQVTAVSQSEAQLFQQFGIGQTTVLGHRLNARATEKPFAERSGLLFVGALRDEGSPNVDSLLWFLINCFPQIESKCPQIKLVVVGDLTAPSLVTVNKSNVEFTGRLASLDELYNECRVFIAPTRFAAGIPHKVHEAASRGIPSVTTPLLAKQLGWKHEQELLCADGAALFAAQCLRLNSDESLWNQIRQGGLTAVERDCSPTVFRVRLMQLFDLPEQG